VDNDPQDLVGHGTLVAGVIGAVADHGQGIAGVAWGSAIMPVRAGFLARNANGAATGLFETDDIAAAIVWAADAGADILNLSLGSASDSAAIGLALDYAISLGVLPVAAAGNDGVHQAGFSNWGAGVELAAPGVDILSLKATDAALATPTTTIATNYLRASGTSLAAPHVAGAAALLLSAQPGQSPLDIAGRLAATAAPLPFSRVSFYGGTPSATAGRLRLRAAFGAGPPRPWLVVEGVALDPSQTSGSNGNRVLEPGETAFVQFFMRNLWRNSQGPTEVRLETSDPYLLLHENLGVLQPLPNEGAGIATLMVGPSSATPPRHRAAADLVLEAFAYSQAISLEIPLNEPVRKTLTLSDLDVLEIVPVSAADGEGNIVVVWRRYNTADGVTRAVGRLLDASGQPQGAEFSVPIPAGGYFNELSITRAQHGPFLVSWWRSPGDGAANLIEAQLFDATGQPSGPVLVANQDSAAAGGVRGAIAPDGRVTLAWTRYASTTSSVLMRHFDALGNPLGDQTVVSDNSGPSNSSPDPVYTASGQLAVSWRHYQSPGQIHTRVRLFGPSGQPKGPSVQVNEEPGGFNVDPRIAADPTGRLMVAWDNCEGSSGPCELRGRVLDSSGVPQSPELHLAVDGPRWISDFALAADGGGRFAVAWEECDLSGPFLLGCGAGFQTLLGNGEPLEPPYLLPDPTEIWVPSIVGARDGFTMVWERVNSGADGIYTARIDLPLDREPCVPGDQTLCLGDGRFEVSVAWKDHSENAGVGTTIPLTQDSGAFWFFRPDNLELLLKVLDGRAHNGHFWIFFGALSDVEYTLVVRDTVTGQTKSYFNPAGQLASRADTRAFAALPDSNHGAGTSEKSGPGGIALLGQRFEVEVEWRLGDGNVGFGSGTTMGDRTGMFWFFNPANLELVVKVLDGRTVNGNFWVYFGALSNVDYTVKVTDTETGRVREYHNPQGRMASVADVEAFTGP
jgi:hypothetical protein